MIRHVASIFAGLVLIYIWMTTAHSFAWWIGGPEFLFADGTRMESVAWSLVSLVIWLSAGVVGGFVCALVARHPTNLPAKVLALVVAVFMGYGAMSYLQVGPPPLPEGIDPVSFEGAQFAIKPTWYLITVAIASAAGVLAGSWFLGGQWDDDGGVAVGD